MKKYHVQITPGAGNNVRAIRDYIALDNVSAARNWVREFKRLARSLDFMPERYEIIPEAEKVGADYRHIIFGNYRLIFRIETKKVIVLRVIHAARILHRGFFDPDPNA